MKKLLWLIITICLVTACKKVIEDKKKDLILDAMTNGQWFVYSFLDGNTDITTSFSPYTFQFYRDGTVSGFTAVSENKGIWVGDPNALTIQSDFPEATEPVNKLNALWKLTNYTYDYVKAEAKIAGVTRKLYLKKK
jgi:hypothetical protein